MGLYRRGKIYWYRIKHQRKRIQKSTGTGNKKLAERIYAKILTEIHEGRYFDQVLAKTKTFDDMMTRYFTECSNKPSTIERKRDALTHLEELFSGKTVAEITPDAVIEYKLKRKGEHAADSTILNEIRLLSNAFSIAIKAWRWCKENPVSQVKLGLKAGKVDRWLTPEEQIDLLKVSEGKLKGQLWDIIIIGLNAGLSQEEIINLKWQNIDLARKTLTTTREKTSDTRTIPLNDTALNLLKKRSRLKSISGFVFFNGANKKIDRWKLKNVFNRAVKESGIRKFRFHDLRHTFATRLAQSGVDIYKIAKLLGHKDVSTTQRYAHHCPESLRDGVDVLEGYNRTTIDNAGKSETNHGQIQPVDFKRKKWRPLHDSNMRHQV
ncbi:MAG: tyrosine-type recombinase/integrase [Planctomycetota bacterium]